MRVLIVDDSRFIQRHMQQVLEEGKHTVVATASNGAEAIELYRQHRPDVVLMDLQMPEMDGVGAAKGIMGLDGSARIILCSATRDPDRLETARRLGVREFLTKPFEKEQIWDAIGKVTMGKYQQVKFGRVLLIDDSKFALAQMKALIEELGHEVVEALEDGSKAAERYVAHKPDLVLMDLNMPGTDGVDALHAIKRRDPAAVVLMCSATRDQDRVVEALKGGARDFLSKPLDKDRLQKAFQSALT